jgi:C1A family cysteine protease
MMRRKAIAAVLVAVCVGLVSCSSYELEFQSFVKAHNKTYKDMGEHAARLQVFRTNLDAINEHNSKNLGWTMAVNKFADLTWDEFKAQHLGYDSSVRPLGNYEAAVNMWGMATLPTAVDWNAKGAVTTPKNQEDCGACWTFSTTGSVEGAVQIKTGKLISLSEQQLMDCSTQNSGCNGGVMDYAFAYIIKNGGLCAESDYPYKAVQGSCRKCNVVSKITSYKDVTSNSENALLAAVSMQPVSVAIEADQHAFQFYSTGVMVGKCGTSLDHGVLCTGFGTDGGKDYWIIKNSWGSDWGEKGFIRIGRNMQSPYGQCGVAMQASYPIA